MMIVVNSIKREKSNLSAYIQAVMVSVHVRIALRTVKILAESSIFLIRYSLEVINIDISRNEIKMNDVR